MVVTALPAVSRMGVVQEVTGAPSSRTVQARHCPSPQPYLMPVKARSSRSTPSSGRSGSLSTARARPLTVSVYFAMWFGLCDHRIAEGRRRQGDASPRKGAQSGSETEETNFGRVSDRGPFVLEGQGARGAI